MKVWYPAVAMTACAYASALAAEPMVYVSLGSGNQVIAIDAAQKTITDSYPGVANSHGLVATPGGEYLVAGSLDEDEGKSKLYLVHPGHQHVMSEITVDGWTHHQAATPDGRYVLSTHPTRGGISVLDVQTNQIARTVETGPGPNYTLVTRDGSRAYVSNTGNGTLSEVDLGDWTVRRTLEAGPVPEHMAFSHDEQTIYVANSRAGEISAVDVQTGKLRRSYSIGKQVHGLDISDDGSTLFVTNRKANELVALDPASGEQRKLSLAPEPYHLNTISGTGTVYVSSHDAPVLWIVDQKSLELLETLDLPAGEGHQMAVVAKED